MQVALHQCRDVALRLAQVEEQLLLVDGGALLTSDHERRMYSWMAALIHHIA
jgi:hypothetical protein